MALVDGWYPQPAVDLQCVKLCGAVLEHISGKVMPFDLRRSIIVLAQNEIKLSARLKWLFVVVQGAHAQTGKIAWDFIVKVGAENANVLALDVPETIDKIQTAIDSLSMTHEDSNGKLKRGFEDLIDEMADLFENFSDDLCSIGETFSETSAADGFCSTQMFSLVQSIVPGFAQALSVVLGAEDGFSTFFGDLFHKDFILSDRFTAFLKQNEADQRDQLEDIIVKMLFHGIFGFSS